MGAPELTMHDLLIRDCAILDLGGARQMLRGQDVAVDGARIAGIGPSGSVGEAKRTLNGKDHILLPGFVNCHTHSIMSLFRGTSDALALQPWLAWAAPRNLRYTEEDVYWAALLACCQMLRGGITTFADMTIRQDIVARAVRETGIRAVLGEGIFAGEVSAAEEGLRGSVERQMARAEDFVADWNGQAEGRIYAGIGPHSVYGVENGMWRELAAMAQQRGCRIHTHISETQIEVEECVAAHGCRPPRLLADLGCFAAPTIGAHCVHMDADDMRIFAQYGVGVSHNPGSNLKLRSGIAPVPAMVQAGVNVGLGTDSAGSNDSLEMWRDCYLAAVLHRWGDGEAPAWSALEMATAAGAAAVHLRDEIGTIEAGKRADLMLVNLASPHLAPITDPVLTLAFAVRGGEVDTVLVDGTIVLEDGRVTTVDEDEIVRQCQTRAERIFGD